ncbi:hypothetical protein [Halococcus sp. AFM35]|uniref:hypothetical protein n=1 Tax=Halococcus sp. AFM35 TaxID=3421653 RepID=UPI003EBAEE55
MTDAFKCDACEEFFEGMAASRWEIQPQQAPPTILEFCGECSEQMDERVDHALTMVGNQRQSGY